MRAALRTWTGGVAAFVVAILAAACSSSTHLPTGVFSGSNAADLPVVIDIGSGSVKVNHRKGSWTRNGEITVGRGATATTYRCRMQGQDEMRCLAKGQGNRETIDLMRL